MYVNPKWISITQHTINVLAFTIDFTIFFVRKFGTYSAVRIEGGKFMKNLFNGMLDHVDPISVMPRTENLYKLG
jgi:hypothetical protein